MTNLEYRVINSVLDKKDLNVLLAPNTDEIFIICPDIWLSIKNYYSKYRAIPSFEIIQERFPDLEYIATTGEPQHYLDELREEFIKNRLSNIMVKQNMALKTNAGPQVLLDLQGELSQLSKYTNASRELNVMDFDDAARHYEQVHKRALEMGGTPGIPTGIDFIDSAYTSGFAGGDLIVVLGWAQPHSEPILTPRGWSTMGALQVGDYVIGSDGQPTKVLEIHERGIREVYRVHFNDGTFVNCDKDHLWTVQTSKCRQNNTGWTTLSTEEISVQPKWNRSDRKTAYRYYMPLPKPVMGTKLGAVVGPYLMGQLLSDGCLTQSSVQLTTNDEEAIKIIREENPHIDVYEITTKTSTARQWRIAGGYKILELVRGAYAHQKSVPAEYMLATPDERLWLLRGLMDGDGHAGAKSRASFSTTSNQLANDVADLSRSLGGVARIRKEKREYKNGEGYVVTVWLEESPFGLSRKTHFHNSSIGFKAVKAVEKLDIMESMKCIKVDSKDNLYITRNYTLTHNTGRGKSALTTLFSCNAWARGFKPMIVSMEMSPEKVRDRIYTILGNGTFKNSSLSLGDVNIDDFRTWSSRHSNRSDFIVMSGNGLNEITPNYVHAKIEEHRPSIVVFDYAQLGSDNGGSLDMTHRMRNMSQQYKSVAVANDIPVVLISSATPDGASAADSPPMIEQVAWSKQLAYDADLAFAVHKGTNSNMFEVVCRKNRSGPLFDGFIDWDMNIGVWKERFEL